MNNLLIFYNNESCCFKNNNIEFQVNVYNSPYFKEKIINKFSNPIIFNFTQKHFSFYLNSLKSKLSNGEFTLLTTHKYMLPVFIYKELEDKIYKIKRDFFLFKSEHRHQVFFHFLYDSKTPILKIFNNFFSEILRFYKFKFWDIKDSDNIYIETEKSITKMYNCISRNEDLLNVIVTNSYLISPSLNEQNVLFTEFGINKKFYSEYENIIKLKRRSLKKSNSIFITNIKDDKFNFGKFGKFDLSNQLVFSKFLWVWLFLKTQNYDSYEYQILKDELLQILFPMLFQKAN